MPPEHLFTLAAAQNVTFTDADLEDHPWLRAWPRYYSAVREIGSGRYSKAYLGYPSDEYGNHLSSALDVKIVIKIPILGSLDRYERKKICDRLNAMREQARVERKHIRNRLRLCDHANPTIDVVPIIDPGDDFDMLGTVQPYLKSEAPTCAMSINSWLNEKGFTKREPADLDPLTGKWKSYLDRSHWLEIALRVAQALREVHMRRVTHGDVHPGNIFLCEDPHLAVLIDFGQAFLVNADTNWSERKQNPFLAPERSGNPFHLNEQVDVYSYGMLLLYLACGNTEPIPDKVHLPIGMRRLHIKQLIQEKNPQLILREPKIIDIISLCTAVDPCDRLRMIDVVEDLSILEPAGSSSPIPVVQDIANSLASIQKKLDTEAAKQNGLLMRLLRYEVRELEYTLEGLDVADMVEFTGTRKHLLRKLVSICERLDDGDSWTAVTTPIVWQHGALGLGGSFTSATIRAVLRGVAVRRAYVVTVEELGLPYCQRFLQQLQKSHLDASAQLATQLDIAIQEYNVAVKKDGGANAPRIRFTMSHITRFCKVLGSLKVLVVDESISHLIAKDKMLNIHVSSGLFLGLHIVGTLAQASAIRAANPAALIHLAKEVDVAKKWTLLVTDIRGRIEDPQKEEPQPLLLHALRVFKSALGGGVPHDRLKCMETLMENVVNIGNCIEVLNQFAQNANEDGSK